MRLRRFPLTACPAAVRAARGTIRTGMAADIPLTDRRPDRGFGGNRFAGIPFSGSQAPWDPSPAERPSPAPRPNGAPAGTAAPAGSSPCAAARASGIRGWPRRPPATGAATAIRAARNAFGAAGRDAAPARPPLAPFIRTTHDVAPRAMLPRIRGHVRPLSWFMDPRLPYIQ